MRYHHEPLIRPLVAWAAGFILWANCASAQAIVPTELSTQEARVRALIEETIRLGVPLYNGGQAQACAAVYGVALRSLLLLAPGSVDQQAITRALRTASNQNPGPSAWTLRDALDAAYLATERNSPVNDERFFIGFSAADDASWYALNDNVMGGVSRGRFALTENETGEFSGQLSLQNNGGFSSVRTQINNAALAGYDGVEMRVRGDERVYALLAAAADARGSWQQNFRATEAWQTIRVPFSAMQLSIRGWRPASSPPLAGQNIDTLGLLIADKDVRPFRLEIDWIRGYVDEVSAAQKQPVE